MPATAIAPRGPERHDRVDRGLVGGGWAGGGSELIMAVASVQWCGAKLVGLRAPRPASPRLPQAVRM